MTIQYTKTKEDLRELLNPRARLTGLPDKYGETVIRIMPRDSLCFYAYWEVSERDLSEARNKLGEVGFELSNWILRVYDLEDTDPEAKKVKSHYDVSVTKEADNYYVNASDTNRSYYVEVGLLTNEGLFLALARSNTISMPHVGFSPITDELWQEFQKELERLFEVSGIHKGTSLQSVKRLIRVHLNEITSVNPISSLSGPNRFVR